MISPKIYKTLFIAIIVIVISAISYYLPQYINSSVSKKKPDLLSHCFTEDLLASHGYRADIICLRQAISILIDTYSAGDLMRYITNESTPTPVVSSCHVIAHAIGQASLETMETLEETLSSCTNLCRNGCVHGAIGAAVQKELGVAYHDEDLAHADIEKIMQIGAKYCSKETSLCHGVGHLLYIAAQDYGVALNSCKSISEGSNAERCYRGVFMESAGAENSLVYSTTTITNDVENLSYPCDEVAKPFRRACFLELPGFHRGFSAEESEKDKADQSKFARIACDIFAGDDRRNCYIGYGYGSVQLTSQKISTEPEHCENFPEVLQRSACSTGVVLKHIDNRNYTEALGYCYDTNEEETRRTCYEAAFQSLEELGSSDMYWLRNLCEKSVGARECALRLRAYKEIKEALPYNS